MAMIARPVRIAALPHARQPATPTPMCRPGSSPAKAGDKHFWWRSDAGTGHGFGKTMLLSAAKAGRTHDGGGYMCSVAIVSAARDPSQKAGGKEVAGTCRHTQRRALSS